MIIVAGDILIIIFREERFFMSGLDIIGDIHGYADHLHRLLKLMDYTEIDGTYINLREG